MPCGSNLAKKKQLQKVGVLNCVVTFAEEMGKLICYEMKLKEDILLNVSSNTMVGFTEDFVCKKDHEECIGRRHPG